MPISEIRAGVTDAALLLHVSGLIGLLLVRGSGFWQQRRCSEVGAALSLLLLTPIILPTLVFVGWQNHVITYEIALIVLS